MKALTLHQPWASLVAMGVKTIETRNWPTKYRGRLYIHAGMRPPEVGYFAAGRSVGHSRITYPDRRVVETYTLGNNDEGLVVLPLGAIVATCELVDVVPIIGAKERLPTPWMPHVAETVNGSGLWLWKGPGPTECLSTGRPPWLHDDITDQLPYGDFTPGRYAWLLDDIKPVDPPVPCRGWQGLWNIPDGVLGQVEGVAA